MVALKPTLDKIKNSDVVNTWLKDLSHYSRLNYQEALAEFCMVNNVMPKDMLNTIYSEEEERLPAWERSINKWFENYDEHCKKLNRAKNTRNIRRTIVNAFIGFHGLPQYRPRGTRRKIEGLKEPNNRENLTKDEIKTLLEVCKSFKLRAIILTQTSSGLAISDVLGLTVNDFFNGLTEIYNEKTDEKIRICKLSLDRIKTGVKFTTFLNEEAVEAVEKYLMFERMDTTPEQALFSSYKNGETFITSIAIQDAYRNLNDYLGWEHIEKGQFRKFTSHMLRKFFNTQLINAGMPEEIREHLMGHKLKDKVREAYFLADPDELMKTYLRYMEHLTIKENTSPVSLDEFQEIKHAYQSLKGKHAKLQGKFNELIEMIKTDIQKEKESVDKIF